MKGEKALMRWGMGLVLFALFSTLALEARGVMDNGAGADSGLRPDIVAINGAAAFGDLELPPVTFLHDKHTEALKGKEQKPCEVCHLKEKDGPRLSFKFKRLSDDNAEALKTVYHDNCLSCHDTFAAENVKTGPRTGECRDCHNADPKYVDARRDMGFTNVLHYRHTSAGEIPPLPAPAGVKPENCGRCHHTYDKAAGKVVPETENEGTCRYCHEDKPYILEDTKDVEVKTLKTASHMECVNCHRELRVKLAEKTGPETCVGCHGEKGQMAVAKADAEALAKLGGDLPRIERGQPNATMVVAFLPDAKVKPRKDGGPIPMLPVPFNHMAHEKANDTCRVCHHEDLSSCVSCHDIQGKKEGGFVQLSQAMHQVGTDKSCVGCHQTRQADPTCAGCHDFIPRPADVVAPGECVKCHQSNLPEGVDIRAMAKEQRGELAAGMLEGRDLKAGLYPVDDIPETVTVAAMSDEYKEAKFPHRRIVTYLADKMKDDKLAGYFHSEKGTLCQGCHHQSPASATPPRCVNCHGKPFGEERAGRPGLKAAYHGQCMGCHTKMGIEGKSITADKPVPLNTDCKGCHEAKK